jgi:hypothetical protein
MKPSLREGDRCLFLIAAPSAAGEGCSGSIDSCMSTDHASIFLIHSSSLPTRSGYFFIQASSFRSHPSIAGSEGSMRDIDRSLRIMDHSIVAIDTPMKTMEAWMIFTDAWIFFSQASIATIEGRSFRIEASTSRADRRWSEFEQASTLLLPRSAAGRLVPCKSKDLTRALRPGPAPLHRAFASRDPSDLFLA